MIWWKEVLSKIVIIFLFSFEKPVNNLHDLSEQLGVGLVFFLLLIDALQVDAEVLFFLCQVEVIPLLLGLQRLGQFRENDVAILRHNLPDRLNLIRLQIWHDQPSLFLEISYCDQVRSIRIAIFI